MCNDGPIEDEVERRIDRSRKRPGRTVPESAAGATPGESKSSTRSDRLMSETSDNEPDFAQFHVRVGTLWARNLIGMKYQSMGARFLRPAVHVGQTDRSSTPT